MTQASIIRVCLDEAVLLPLAEEPSLSLGLIWPGVGACFRTMHWFSLAPTGRTVRFRHPQAEAVYYILGGAGRVIDEDTGEQRVISGGAVVYVTPGTAYRLEAGPEGLEFVGGPCPPDADLYRSVGGQEYANANR